jgi:hypothetical protein
LLQPNLSSQDLRIAAQAAQLAVQAQAEISQGKHLEAKVNTQSNEDPAFSIDAEQPMTQGNPSLQGQA